MKISWSVGTRIAGGFGIALAILMFIGGPAYRSTSVLITNSRWVVHTDKVMISLECLLSKLQDAETGQRQKGFEPTMKVVASDKGKKAMDDTRGGFHG